MGGGKGKKRKLEHISRDDTEEPNLMGIGSTLAQLRGPPTDAAQQPAEAESHSESGEWQTVTKGKKRKQKQTNYPSLTFSESYRMQSSVKLSDLQNLVLYCLADGPSPQWVALRHHTMIKKAVVLFVPGLEKGMFDGGVSLDADESRNQQESSGASTSINGVGNGSANENAYDPHAVPSSLPDEYLPTPLDADKLPNPLKPLAETFSHLWPVKSPGDDKMGKVHSPLQAMLQSPLSKTREEKRAEKETKGPKLAREGKHWQDKRTRVYEFLLSPEDLQENEYVVHPSSFEASAERENNERLREKNSQGRDSGWLDSHVKSISQAIVPEGEIEQGSILAGRELLSMDCEMCKVEGNEYALTRISLLNSDGEIVMDEFVKPEKAIIDYLTRYSGITPAKLSSVTTSLHDIQERLLALLKPRTILIGHSLNSDLNALKLTHPFIIDTSVLYPHPRGPPLKSSLKFLAQKYLGREIQKGHGTDGHDSIEDARACLDLVKLKCEKGPLWGTHEAAHEPIFKRIKRSRSDKNMHSPGGEGTIIDHGNPERNFGSMASYCIGCKSDSEVVEATRRAVLGDTDGAYIPGGGVAFTWARFRELENARGWRNDQGPAAAPPPLQSNATAIPTSTNTNDVIPTIDTDINNISPDPAPPAPAPLDLPSTLSTTITHLKTIRSFLPPCTLLIIYTGTGDPREMARLQEIQRTYRREYKVKKWDELSVKWTDVEEQCLRRASRKAREGMGLICVV